MSRPVRAALALALSFSLLSAPALAQRPGRGGMPGGGLTPAGNPSALIAAEIAFARLAREKGQWTAFRDTAADDAEMFTPRRVVAKDWLKGRKDPAQAVQWETHRAYASCDGSFGVTYGGWTGGADAGWFSTVWQRQKKKGALKWVLDQGELLARPLAAPDWIEGKVADCPARRTHFVAPGEPPPPGAADRPAKKDLPVQRPLAGPLPALAAPAGSDSKDGQSDDGTLAWRSTVLPDGAREFTVWMWKDGNMAKVLHETAAAPAAPATTPTTTPATAPGQG